MNREFLKKLVKAELLRYEALKEILPENMKNRLESLERDAGCLIKDIAFDLMAEGLIRPGSKEQEEPSRADSQFAEKKTVRKVQVDFS